MPRERPIINWDEVPGKNRHLYDQYRFEVKKMNELKKIPTAQLAEELGSREGVEIKIAEPYAKSKIEIEGPAIVLIVTA